MRFKTLWMSAILLWLFVLASSAQSSAVTGTLLKWDTEAYSKSRTLVANAVVYYIQVDKTVYHVTRKSTKPDTYLVAGSKVQCRIDKDAMYIPNEKGKEVKYRILGAAAAE
jgi:hypothetical protein